jgi:arylsulfatase A-like enzyme
MTALIADLKDRGLLDDTLVVWMGEFGRTPKTHDKSGSRNHYDKAWSTVLFGGGAPGGAVVGKTDDKAAEVVERPVSGPDFMATVLTLLGIDPAKHLHAGSRPVRTVAPGAMPVPEIVGKR